MHISSPDGYMVASLQNQGTTIYIDTWTPSDEDLESYPHIVLTSPHLWNPQTVEFPNISHSEQEEVEMRSLKAIHRVSDCSNVESYCEDIGFREPEYIEESPNESDIVMNVG